MTRAYHRPIPHPTLAAIGHWEGDLDERGETVDVLIFHCMAHPDHVRDGCAACAAQGGTDDAE